MPLSRGNLSLRALMSCSGIYTKPGVGVVTGPTGSKTSTDPRLAGSFVMPMKAALWVGKCLVFCGEISAPSLISGMVTLVLFCVIDRFLKLMCGTQGPLKNHKNCRRSCLLEGGRSGSVAPQRRTSGGPVRKNLPSVDKGLNGKLSETQSLRRSHRRRVRPQGCLIDFALYGGFWPPGDVALPPRPS